MSAIGQFIAVNVDCDDPPKLAAFYQ
ncbi:MAG: hypothetical protein QOH50_14, partial [Kribbellaceae bacterium]|nr:hypothetical protein [Kribbellaceae bacterium]